MKKGYFSWYNLLIAIMSEKNLFLNPNKFIPSLGILLSGKIHNRKFLAKFI
ncbi:hypothetical protein [Thermosipho sp. 1244]|uniref:hypothetical protein n=1 Tax=Thermosipho sp. 1244 TaxID=1755816 RepID=UPI0018CC34B5|nr:hypothetical protein [Thermosipho sp. 1244]